MSELGPIERSLSIGGGQCARRVQALSPGRGQVGRCRLSGCGDHGYRHRGTLEPERRSDSGNHRACRHVSCLAVSLEPRDEGQVWNTRHQARSRTSRTTRSLTARAGGGLQRSMDCCGRTTATMGVSRFVSTLETANYKGVSMYTAIDQVLPTRMFFCPPTQLPPCGFGPPDGGAQAQATFTPVNCNITLMTLCTPVCGQAAH